MPLVIDLLDNKDLLETCIDNAVGLSSAGESAGTVDETSLGFFGCGTKEHPSEKVDPAGKEELWVTVFTGTLENCFCYL